MSLSGALFLSSNAISSSFTDGLTEYLKGSYGSAALVITPKTDSETRFINKSVVPEQDDIEAVIGKNMLTGIYKNGKNVNILNITSTDLLQFKSLGTLNIDNKDLLGEFQGPQMIVSEKFLLANQLKIGDNIRVNINQGTVRFMIAATGEGLFFKASQMKDSFNVIIPERLGHYLLNSSGSFGELLIKVKSQSNEEQLQNDLSTTIDKFQVNKAVDKKDLEKELSVISLPFLFITMLVIIMSSFITYSAFKMITFERLPIIGTFRSVGSSSRSIFVIFITEGILYGFLATLLSLPIGFFILKGMIWFIQNSFTEFSIPINFVLEPSNIVKTFILILSISFLSPLIPIIKVSKLPIKEVVLGKTEKEKNNSIKKRILSIVFLVLSLFLGFYSNGSEKAIIIVFCVVVLFIGSILLSSFITQQWLKIFGRISSFFSFQNFELALKNMRSNDNISQNITVLQTGIFALLLVMALSNTTESLMLRSYENTNWDMTIVGDKLDKRTLSKLNSIEQVQQIYPFYTVSNVKISNTSNTISIGSINIKKQDIFYPSSTESKANSLYQDLNGGDRIILSSSVIKSYGLDISKPLKLSYTLILPTGKRTVEKNFQVVREMNLNNSDALMEEAQLYQTFRPTSYSEIKLITDNPDFVKEKIKQIFLANSVIGRTKIEDINAERSRRCQIIV